MRDDLDALREELMKNPEFKGEYQALQPEFNIIQAIMDVRKQNNLTQKELAQRTGISQVDISALEAGDGNPTLGLLQRLAEGLGMTLKLEFVPKESA